MYQVLRGIYVGGGLFWGPRHGGQDEDLSTDNGAVVRRMTLQGRPQDTLKTCDANAMDKQGRHLRRGRSARQDRPTSCYVPAGTDLQERSKSQVTDNEPDRGRRRRRDENEQQRWRTRHAAVKTKYDNNGRHDNGKDADLRQIAHLQRTLLHRGGAIAEQSPMQGLLNQAQTQGLPPSQLLEPSTKLNVNDDTTTDRKSMDLAPPSPVMVLFSVVQPSTWQIWLLQRPKGSQQSRLRGREISHGIGRQAARRARDWTDTVRKPLWRDSGCMISEIWFSNGIDVTHIGTEV